MSQVLSSISRTVRRTSGGVTASTASPRAQISVAMVPIATDSVSAKSTTTPNQRMRTARVDPTRIVTSGASFAVRTIATTRTKVTTRQVAEGVGER